MAELADAPDLGSGGKPWGFKSPLSHQKRPADSFIMPAVSEYLKKGSEKPMKYDVEVLGATKRRLKVEIPPAEVESALDNAYLELNKSVKVDGFRPGHTPRHILEKRYGKTVEADVVEKIVPEFYYRALEEAKLFPVDQPAFEEKNFTLAKGQPLTFTASVEVRPDFELKEYRGIELKDEPGGVTEEELGAALDDLRDMHSTLETVPEDRPVTKGDLVVIDFEGFIGDTPFEGGKAENYTLELGSGHLIPGFEEQVEGMKKGDGREISVKFPDEYKNAGLAGKDARFKVTMKDIKKKVRPELDDEFAKDLSLGATLDELKEKVRADIMVYKERARTGKLKDLAMKAVAGMHVFELPASMVEKELRSMVMRRYQDAMQSGAKMTPDDLKSYEAEARPQAEERVKITLLLAAIADKEGIKVSDTEVEAGIRRLAAETGYDPKAIRELYERRDGSLEGLRGIIGEDKVLELLVREGRKV